MNRVPEMKSATELGGCLFAGVMILAINVSIIAGVVFVAATVAKWAWSA